MGMLESVLLVVHVIIALAICGLVLLQHGKGADMGAAFGSGSSGSLFGAAGSANFLSRSTAILAAVFFMSSVGLTWFASTRGKPGGLMEKAAIEKTVPAPKAGEAPVLPAAPKADTAPASKAADVPK